VTVTLKVTVTFSRDVQLYDLPEVEAVDRKGDRQREEPWAAEERPGPGD